MPLALKHSWAGKRRERRIASATTAPLALAHAHARTHTEFSAAGPGGAGGRGFPPGPAAPHLVLGEAEMRHPLSHFLGAPGQEGADGPRSPRALGLRLRPFSHSRPRGTRARLHRLHPQATTATRLPRTPLPWQPSLPGGAPPSPFRLSLPAASLQRRPRPAALQN